VGFDGVAVRPWGSGNWQELRISSVSSRQRAPRCRSGDEGLACAPGTASLYAAGGWPPCVPCEPGTYAPATAAATCTACSRGAYTIQIGSTECAQCPADPPPQLMLPENAAACAACGYPCCGDKVGTPSRPASAPSCAPPPSHSPLPRCAPLTSPSLTAPFASSLVLTLLATSSAHPHAPLHLVRTPVPSTPPESR
jgi:hypothetical protein